MQRLVSRGESVRHLDGKTKLSAQTESDRERAVCRRSLLRYIQNEVIRPLSEPMSYGAQMFAKSVRPQA